MVIEPIVWRRSVREYSEEPVLEEAVESIIRAAQFAPTAHGTRQVEFVIIKDQKIKDSLCEVLGQDFIKKAPVLIVPVAEEESDFKVADISVATAFMMIQAAALGLGTVWKNVDIQQGKDCAKIIGLPQAKSIINMMPVGYPATDLPDHGENDFDPGKIHFDQY